MDEATKLSKVGKFDRSNAAADKVDLTVHIFSFSGVRMYHGYVPGIVWFASDTVRYTTVGYSILVLRCTYDFVLVIPSRRFLACFVTIG